MPIPKRIDTDPIIEAIVEIRFETSVPSSAAFGLIYNEIKDLFTGTPVALPLNQLPEYLRENDPNLKYQPIYRIDASRFVFQVGPRMIGFVCKDPYVGWDQFWVIIKDAFHKVAKSTFIQHFDRIGIRYVNFFKENLLELADVKFLINGNPPDAVSTQIRCEIEEEDFIHIIYIAGPSLIKGKENVGKGWILDIDTSCTKQLTNPEDVLALIFKGHQLEKERFFLMIGESIIKARNPEF
ncbi:MAG: TIGR04255 family protein [Porphyromonadaceae bacterium]|nr:MAG: TIGR04255 family protein [Porphyromonadaceae bacterium]